jgi:hypothetical protein
MKIHNHCIDGVCSSLTVKSSYERLAHLFVGGLYIG